MQTTLMDQLNMVPPFMVRALARRVTGKHVHHMGVRDIASASGISLITVQRISRKRSWHGMKVELAQRFAEACGHDLLRPRKSLQYLARVAKTGKGFSHLTTVEKRHLAQMLKPNEPRRQQQ